MPRPQEIEQKVWTALESDMTMMFGLGGVEDGHARPMTAQLDGERGPIWFFTSRDNAIVQKLLSGSEPSYRDICRPGHDIFATVQGSLVLDNSRAVIDRFWNRYIAAWYQGG